MHCPRDKYPCPTFDKSIEFSVNDGSPVGSSQSREKERGRSGSHIVFFDTNTVA